MSFKVGDRVKVPKGVEGTVKFVGKVKFASGVHVGVELDSSAGDNDGKKQGKRYFQCKKKHGVIEKAAYFTAVKGGGKGKKPRKSVAGKGKKPRSSKGPKNLEPIDEGKGGKKGKKGKKGKEASPSPSPAPQIVTASIGMQTEAPREMLDYVANEYYCKIITRVYAEENDKLRKQRDEAIDATLGLQQRVESAESRVKQLEYEIKQSSVELDPLKESLEMKEIEIEELNIKLEIANFEIEELNEKLAESLDSYVEKIASDDKENAQVIKLNEELQQQLSILVKVGQELMDSKDKHINRLATESDYVDSLAARLKDLLSVEQEVLGLKSKVQQLEDKCLSLEDADAMCQTLTEYNNSLEGELSDWRCWVLDVEAERKILEELHEDDDEHIVELTKEKKDLEVQLFELDKENKQFNIERQDLQKELFELRNKMKSQDISAAKSYEKFNFVPIQNSQNNEEEENNNNVDVGANMDKMKNVLSGKDGGNHQLESIWNENIKLSMQLKEIRNAFMDALNQSIEGQAHYVEYELMKQYLPQQSSEVDFKGIAVLALIHRILYKAKACRKLLEDFFADPSSKTVQNPNLAMMSHTLCPIILTQENYLRAIQIGFLNIESEDADSWQTKTMGMDKPFGAISQTYDVLLSGIKNAIDSNELSFDIELLTVHEATLSKFVQKHFAEFSPEKEKSDAHRCPKPIVLQCISESHYRFQSLSIKLNQFNAKLFDFVHAPSQSTNTISEDEQPEKIENNESTTNENGDMNEDEDENKYEENDANTLNNDIMAENELENALKTLKIGAVEKLFRLRNDVITSTKQILLYCQPVELGYRKEKYSLNLLKDANQTSIKWSNLKSCKHIAFKLVQRVTKMLDKINANVDLNQTPRKRVANINAIIADEEEQNEEGLISLLEKAYNIVSDVRKVIGSTMHQTEATTDDMAAHEYPKYNVPVWEAHSGKFRVLFEKQKELQLQLENQKVTIEESVNVKKEIEKELKQKVQMIEILAEQNVKEKDKSKALADIQNANSKLTTTNDKLKSDILSYRQKISAQSEEIAAKSAAIEKYKKAIARNKDMDSPLSSSSIQRQPSVPTSSTISVVKSGGGGGGNKQQQIANAAQVKHGTILVDHEVEYSSLLEQTVQSLRRKVTQLTMTKKLTNCELNLKPLPFVLLRDEIIEKIHGQIEENKEKMKTKKDENKDESKDEDKNEAEEKDDDEKEQLENENKALSKKMDAMKKQKESVDAMQNKLNLLSSSLDNIRSQPMIVDLSKKRQRNDDLSQQIIGRQMKLREVGLKYERILANIKNKNAQNSEEKSEFMQEFESLNATQIASLEKMGCVLGQIEIPNSSLKSIGYNGTQRVMLPSQQFNSLQTSFLF